MLKKIINILKSKSSEIISDGLGMTDLPYKVYQGKQPIKSSDFKKILNKIFLPKIYELGFKGKDFYYYREYQFYTQAVFFWTYQTGGAIQVDLLVKFKGIDYPDNENYNVKKVRPINSEFQKRLSPNNNKKFNGQEVWFWVFEDNLEMNVQIVEDIWRVFLHKGINYFNNFENTEKYLEEIKFDNYFNFPDFKLCIVFGRGELGIVFFLFRYWEKVGNEKKMKEFAEIGYKLSQKKQNFLYLSKFEEYLKLRKNK